MLIYISCVHTFETKPSFQCLTHTLPLPQRYHHRRVRCPGTPGSHRHERKIPPQLFLSDGDVGAPDRVCEGPALRTRKYQWISWNQKTVRIRTEMRVRDSGRSPDKRELFPGMSQLLPRATGSYWEYSSIFHQNVGDRSVGRWIISFLKTTRSPLFSHTLSSDKFICPQPRDVFYVCFSYRNTFVFVRFYSEMMFWQMLFFVWGTSFESF